MDQEPPPLCWDFTLARRFLRAFNYKSDEDSVAIESYQCKIKAKKPQSLGDFDQFFDFCRSTGLSTATSKPLQIPCANPRHLSSGSSSSLPSDYSTAASTSPDVAQQYTLREVKEKEVRWKDEAGSGTLVESQNESSQAAIGNPEECLEERKPSFDHTAHGYLLPSIKPKLAPSSDKRIRPPPDIPYLFIDKAIINPFFTLTPQEQKMKLIKKLLKRYHSQPTSLFLTDPVKAITQMGGNVHTEGIHVFVDCSNINIGFQNKLKSNRNMHPKQYVKQVPMSYHSLALILERGRQVARRVVVGSTIHYEYNQQQKRPQHFTEAEKCGYEVNILERVCKPKIPTNKSPKRKAGSGNGYATTSGSETYFNVVPTMAEQGVDEILHMKLLESIVDTSRPSTIVLASGDAAEAEYSGGFLKNVERALLKGWKIELVAWRDGLSKDYMSVEFLNKWEGKFSIVLLDEFCEEMLAVYSHPVVYLGSK